MCDYYVIFTSSKVKRNKNRKKRNDEEEEVKRDGKHFMEGKRKEKLVP